MHQSSKAIGNLINRYAAVLKKCRLLNTFGSMAIASALLISLSVSPVWAYDMTVPVQGGAVTIIGGGKIHDITSTTDDVTGVHAKTAGGEVTLNGEGTLPIEISNISTSGAGKAVHAAFADNAELTLTGNTTIHDIKGNGQTGFVTGLLGKGTDGDTRVDGTLNINNITGGTSAALASAITTGVQQEGSHLTVTGDTSISNITAQNDHAAGVLAERAATLDLGNLNIKGISGGQDGANDKTISYGMSIDRDGVDSGMASTILVNGNVHIEDIQSKGSDSKAYGIGIFGVQNSLNVKGKTEISNIRANAASGLSITAGIITLQDDVDISSVDASMHATGMIIAGGGNKSGSLNLGDKLRIDGITSDKTAFGIYSVNTGAVTIEKDAEISNIHGKGTVDTERTYGINAITKSTVNVKGNVHIDTIQAENVSSFGITSDVSSISIGGNAVVSNVVSKGSNSYGAYANSGTLGIQGDVDISKLVAKKITYGLTSSYNGAKFTIGGNAKLSDLKGETQVIGSYAYTKGIMEINGTLDIRGLTSSLGTAYGIYSSKGGEAHYHNTVSLSDLSAGTQGVGVFTGEGSQTTFDNDLSIQDMKTTASKSSVTGLWTYSTVQAGIDVKGSVRLGNFSAPVDGMAYGMQVAGSAASSIGIHSVFPLTVYAQGMPMVPLWTMACCL